MMEKILVGVTIVAILVVAIAKGFTEQSNDDDGGGGVV